MKWELREQESVPGGCRLSLDLSGIPAHQPGILYKITAVFYAHRLSVDFFEIGADAAGRVKDSFRLSATEPIQESDLTKMESDLEDLLDNRLQVQDYLETRNRVVPLFRPRETTGEHSPEIIVGPLSGEARMDWPADIPPAEALEIRLRGLDRPGLLHQISELFFLLEIDILFARTPGGSPAQPPTETGSSREIRDIFIIRGPRPELAHDPRLQRELAANLREILLGVS